MITTLSRRVRILSSTFGLVALGALLVLVWLLNSEPPAVPVLLLSREAQAGTHAFQTAILARRSGIVLDDLRQKYGPSGRGTFLVSSTQDASIFVRATGVQVPTPSGWKTEAEDYRGEIWRLKAGIPREVCVDRPRSYAWRAYVRYGIEMKGLPLFRAQLQEAWSHRSFSNWTGKAWGGGRFGGLHEIFSEEVTE